MSERVDRFCNTLRDRLNAVEARLENAKATVEALPGKAERAVRDGLDEVRTEVEARKGRAEKARANLKAWGERKKAETRAAIEQWKQKGEVKMLSARADDAEAYAEDAILIALATMEEAEAAIFEAVGARMDAEAASSVSTGVA